MGQQGSDREIHEWTVAEQRDALAARRCSAVELAEHCLMRIAALDPALNSLLCVDHDGARAAALAADARRARHNEAPLTGVPIVHKDVFCTEGVATTAGSRMLRDFVPPYDATVVARLREVGAVMLGKANMDEFAMGSSNENSAFGAVANPWDHRRVPGGSSGGSAAAVAAGLCAAATGTDTGGSVRQPAAFCGLTGLKPTYGRVSRYGMIAFASSLEQAGVLARSAEDCALLLQAMAGVDERDATSSDAPVCDYEAALEQDLAGLRVGVPREFFEGGLDDAVAACVERAIESFARLGARVSEISLPTQSLGIPAYYVVAPAEASSNLSRFDGVRFGHRAEPADDITGLYERSRAEGFGPEVKRRIMVGTYVLSAGYYEAYYLKAQQVRRRISDDFRRAFADVDVIAGPTTPDIAFARGTHTDDPVSMYLGDLYTVAANLTGLPAMSVPCGVVDDLPVGLQLIGAPFSEARLLNVSHRYQQITDWHCRRAPDGTAAGERS